GGQPSHWAGGGGPRGQRAQRRCSGAGAALRKIDGGSDTSAALRPTEPETGSRAQIAQESAGYTSRYPPLRPDRAVSAPAWHHTVGRTAGRGSQSEAQMSAGAPASARTPQRPDNQPQSDCFL